MKNSTTPFWKAAQLDFSWNTIKDYLYILAGTLVQAFAMRLFLIPGQLVSGGISGAAQLINYYTHWPIGLMVFIGNAPLFLLGWRHLGGPKFVFRTALAILSFSFFTDFLGLFISANGMTHDLVLTTLYGGLMLGIGLGLVYRGKGTSGGSDILGRILNHRFGISISQAYLMTRLDCRFGCRICLRLGICPVWLGDDLCKRTGSRDRYRRFQRLPDCAHRNRPPNRGNREDYV